MAGQVVRVINSDNLLAQGGMSDYRLIGAGDSKVGVLGGTIAVFTIEAVVLDLIEDQVVPLGEKDRTGISVCKEARFVKYAIQDHINIIKLFKFLNGIED